MKKKKSTLKKKPTLKNKKTQNRSKVVPKQLITPNKPEKTDIKSNKRRFLESLNEDKNDEN